MQVRELQKVFQEAITAVEATPQHLPVPDAQHRSAQMAYALNALDELTRLVALNGLMTIAIFDRLLQATTPAGPAAPALWVPGMET